MRLACLFLVGLLGLLGGCIVIEKTVTADPGSPAPDGGVAASDGSVTSDGAPPVDASPTPPPDPAPQPPPTPSQILSAMALMESIQGFHLGSCVLWSAGAIKPGNCEARANFVKDPPAPQHQNYGVIMFFNYGATGDEYEFQAWPSFLLTGALYDVNLSTPVEVLAASASVLRYRHQVASTNSTTYTVTKTFEIIDGALEVTFKYEKPNTATLIAFAVLEL